MEFGAADRERLIAVLLLQFLEPINDLLVLPSKANALVKFDHHEVVHISCANADDINAVIASMTAARFALPDELPDATFKRPGWMR